MEASVPTYLQHQPSSHRPEIPNHGKVHPPSPIKLIFLNVFNRSKDPHNF